MERGNKARVLYILKELSENSDIKNQFATADLIRILNEKYNVKAYRTTISKDIALLRECGIDVIVTRGRQNKYFIGTRAFEVEELKMLIDAVTSSKLITARNTRILIAKLTTLASEKQATQLKRNLRVNDKDKPDSDRQFLLSDKINQAINTHSKISFRCFEYDASKKKQPKSHGSNTISPYTLLWNGDRYYVIGFSDDHGRILVFRTDRIVPNSLIILNERSKPVPEGMSISELTNNFFRGEDEQRTMVRLICSNELMDALIDHFGEKVKTCEYSQTEFELTVETPLNQTFYGWLFGFAGRIRILEPEYAMEEYRRLAEAID